MMSAKTRWVLSSVGRATPLQGVCQRFDPVSTHHHLPTTIPLPTSSPTGTGWAWSHLEAQNDLGARDARGLSAPARSFHRLGAARRGSCLIQTTPSPAQTKGLSRLCPASQDQVYRPHILAVARLKARQAETGVQPGGDMRPSRACYSAASASALLFSLCASCICSCSAILRRSASSIISLSLRAL